MSEKAETGESRNRSGEQSNPRLTHRIQAFLLYVGFAPVAWRLVKRPSQPYLRTHYNQSLALWAVMGVILSLFALMALALSLAMVYNREWAESRGGEDWILSITRKAFLVWGVFWLFSLWRSLRGSTDTVPFLHFLVRSTFIRGTGLVVLSIFFCITALLAPLTLQAENQVTRDPSQGKVFFLYDDLGLFPRPLFSLAMYRLSKASNNRWGPDSAILLPLSRDSINLALRGGTFVFIGSHGTAAGLLLGDGYYRPEDVPRLTAGEGPAYVYLAGCDSGAQREAWEGALRPATVKTYDRLTPTLEHLWWLWTEGPRIVHDLERPFPTSEGTLPPT